jgi:hypothetical protein
MKQLLEKYYAGETSLEEEELIRNYFSSTNTGSDFEIENQLFGALDLNKSFAPENLEAEIMKSIQESESKVIKTQKISLKAFSTWAAAALLVFSVGFGWYFSQTRNPKMLADTYQDPQIAYQETMRVLALVGSKMDKARQNLQPIEKLDNAVKVLEPVSKVNEKLEIVRRVDRIQNPRNTEK